MSEQEMISVAFITPICLLTLTSLVLVARVGVKAAVTRAFELEDGKQTKRDKHQSPTHWTLYRIMGRSVGRTPRPSRHITHRYTFVDRNE